MKAAASLALALGACAAAPSPDATPWSPEIEGPQWRLVAIAGQPTEQYATVSFGNAGVSGLTDCFAFAGPAGAPDALAIWPVRFTFGACPDDGREDPFFAALAAARVARREGDALVLDDGNGDPLMRFVVD